MKGLLIAFGLIACAVALPAGETGCGGNCGPFSQCRPCNPEPPLLARSDCGLAKDVCEGEHAAWLLWPHPSNQSQFMQCPGKGKEFGEPIERDCPCATLFNYEIQKCVHPHEWTQQCLGQPANPEPMECPKNPCEECEKDPNPDPNPEPEPEPEPSTDPTDEPSTEPSPPPTPPSCPCVCVPCIAWPCFPCPNSCCRSFG